MYRTYQEQGSIWSQVEAGDGQEQKQGRSRSRPGVGQQQGSSMAGAAAGVRQEKSMCRACTGPISAPKQYFMSRIRASARQKQAGAGQKQGRSRAGVEHVQSRCRVEAGPE